MKLKTEFEAADMGDEIIMVPVGDKAPQIHGVLKLNKAGAEIASLLFEDTTEDQIIDALKRKFENTDAELRKYTHEVIDVLRSNNLLIE